MNRFKVIATFGQARVGRLKTAHGVIETPTFIPVGTQATVKALPPKELKEIGVQAVLANTYHLMLRPGADLIEKLGGLHNFMAWDGPIMTDSGGFQVFSLGVALEHGVGKLLREDQLATPGVEAQTSEKVKPRLNKINEEGVIFQSHLDGSKQTLDPEKSIDLQFKLGADLIVSFDDLESPKHSYEETLRSLELTERWELRSLQEYYKKTRSRSKVRPGSVEPLLYGVTHGGIFEDLRIRSAKFVDAHFEGIALGGAHKDRPTLYQVVEWTVANVSAEKPRHLLGIGEIEDLFECVERGVDLFDCAAPSRRARNGSLYSTSPDGEASTSSFAYISPTSGVYPSQVGYQKNNFTLSIMNSRYKNDPQPIDPTCHCYTCQNFSRAYLRHLFMAKEILFYELATIHNIYFLTKLMEKIRQGIKDQTLSKLKKSWLQ